jgi:hypothetical protein
MFLGGGTFETVTASHPIAEVSLSTNFEISFELYFSALPAPGDVNNILQLRNKATDAELISIGVTSNSLLNVAFNGVVYQADGPSIGGPGTSYTSVTFNMGYGKVSLYAQYDGGHMYTYAASNLPSVSGQRYTVYASGPAGASAGGRVRNFHVRGKNTFPSSARPHHLNKFLSYFLFHHTKCSR